MDICVRIIDFASITKISTLDSRAVLTVWYVLFCRFVPVTIMLSYIFLADGFCDGHVCCKNAQCDNFLCKCQKGYYGDGYDRCDRKLKSITFHENF